MAVASSDHGYISPTRKLAPCMRMDYYSTVTANTYIQRDRSTILSLLHSFILSMFRISHTGHTLGWPYDHHIPHLAVGILSPQEDTLLKPTSWSRHWHWPSSHCQHTPEVCFCSTTKRKAISFRALSLDLSFCVGGSIYRLNIIGRVYEAAFITCTSYRGVSSRVTAPPVSRSRDLVVIFVWGPGVATVLFNVTSITGITEQVDSLPFERAIPNSVLAYGPLCSRVYSFESSLGRPLGT